MFPHVVLVIIFGVSTHNAVISSNVSLLICFYLGMVSVSTHSVYSLFVVHSLFMSLFLILLILFDFLFLFS